MSTDGPDLAALSAWAPELARTFVSLASDIALVIDADGVIRNVEQGRADPIAPGAVHWVGRAWIDTVSGETRPKIEKLLKEVAATGIARRREVNHPLAADASVPIAYTAIRLGTDGPVLAVGRDLRAIAAIQQRYVESQQDLERGYWQARQAETRYQLLFQVATDAVLVVDGETLQIVEANEAAAGLLDAAPEQLRGRHVSAGFEHHARAAVTELLSNARATGRSGEIRARLRGSHGSASVVATPFRADAAMRLLVRIRALDGGEPSASLNRTLSRLVDDARDGVVVTDSSGRILIANPAFLALAHVGSEAQAKGQPLMTWLGLADQPFAALLAKVRRDGIARNVVSWVRRAAAPALQVEVAAALLTEGDQECIGFTMHPTGGDAGRRILDEAAENALTLLLRAGFEALGKRLDEREIAVVIHQAAASLGVSPERLARRIGSDSDAVVEPDPASR
jgi:transcriptional regulator PpsR